jgi:hypothetical protein
MDAGIRFDKFPRVSGELTELHRTTTDRLLSEAQNLNAPSITREAAGIVAWCEIAVNALKSVKFFP